MCVGLTVNQLLGTLKTKQFLVLFNNKEDVISEWVGAVLKLASLVQWFLEPV